MLNNWNSDIKNTRHKLERRHSQNKVKWLRRGGIVMCIAVAFLAGYLGGMNGLGSSVLGNDPMQPVKVTNPKDATLHSETVIGIGGSIAYGWKDPNNDSYMQRAFETLSASTNTNYQYINHCKVGASSTWFVAQQMTAYEQWLTQLKPSAVVISWGLLDDIAHQVSVARFDAAVRQEINVALAHHAVVMLVTPPVSLSAYLYQKPKMEPYIEDEFKIVKSLHNPNVQIYDVFNQMLNYMAAHHQDYKPYFGDNWHPNQAGHVLAGQILENDILTTLGQGPIMFKMPSLRAVRG